MLTTEFNMEDAIAVWKEEGLEEGRTEIVQKMKAGGMSIEDVSRILSMTVNETKQYYEI